MASRQRSAPADGAANAAPGPTLLSLPDDVLVQCLAQLTLKQRFQTVALACKHLRALCMAPPLLEIITVDLRQPETAVPRLRSLLRLLQAYGQHVRQLRIHDQLLEELSPGQQQEAGALLPVCLSTCSGPASSLTCLELWDVPLPSLAWLPGLTALQILELECRQQPLPLPPGLQHLTRLTELVLFGTPLQMEQGAQLPPSVLQLHLCDGHNEELLPEVSQLTQLTSLLITECAYTPNGLGAIQGIPSLRSLRILNGPVPTCLPALTLLQQLFVISFTFPADVSEQLDAALPQLRSLTALVIHATSPSIPPAVRGLSRLQRLSWCSFNDAQQPADTSLPAGPWLASIRWLGLPWRVLERAVGTVLAAAQQLEYLCSLGVPTLAATGGEESTVCWRRFWRFLASHPPLRCFGIEVGQYGDVEGDVPASPELVRALLLLRGFRPALRIRYLSSDFESEVTQHKTIPETDPSSF